jgi:hypothetical protein
MAQIAKIVITLTLLASLFGLNGCTNVENATNSTATTTVPPSQSSNPTSQTPNPPTSPTRSETSTGDVPLDAYVNLSFTNGAPRLNETAQLRCIVGTPGLTADNISVIINLPDGLQYISGDLSAQLGSMSGYANKESLVGTKEITAVIKPLRTGHYTIEAQLYLVPRNPSIGSGPGLFRIYLSVSDNSSEWGTVPFWIPSGPVPITPYKN